MKALHLLFACTLALPFVPSLASADELTLAVQMQRRVEAALLKPLADADRAQSRFSRARTPPSERRVRMPQTTAVADKAGRSFMVFAVDVRSGGQWQENDIVGCIYTANGALYVKRGDTYRPAGFLLGQKADPVPGVCDAAPPRA